MFDAKKKICSLSLYLSTFVNLRRNIGWIFYERHIMLLHLTNLFIFICNRCSMSTLNLFAYSPIHSQRVHTHEIIDDLKCVLPFFSISISFVHSLFIITYLVLIINSMEFHTFFLSYCDVFLRRIIVEWQNVFISNQSIHIVNNLHFTHE